MDNTLLSPKEQLVEDLRATVESIDARLKENETIIEQNRAEVERLQQKSVNVSAQIKRIEENFDSVPRQDIKVAYESAIDTRTRHVSMRSQLEKLEDNQRYMEEYRDKIDQILGMLESVTLGGGPAAVGDGGGAPRRLSLGGEQIVRIVEAQESERKALANALHDGPAQSLTNFILQAEICQRLFDRDPDTASTELNNLKAAASSSFQKVRDFIFELRPMMLDDLGLIATIRRHTENYNDKYENIDINFHLTGAESRFPNHIEVMMFRGLQTLISNSIEILNAKTVDIRLDIGEDRLIGTVEDDGRTFDAEVELDRSQGDSPLQNLLDLRERLQMVDGNLDIFSAEGEVNSVQIVLPLIDLEP
jgi:two-component system sensor histidine kinase DegS